jgi:hypothetical protein
MSETNFKHLLVEFFTKAKQNRRESAKQGRAIFDDVEMVKIRIAGDQKSVFVAPAHDASSVRDPHDNQRLTYAQLHRGPYEAFKRGQTYIGSGTPLKELPFITNAKQLELEAQNVFTAEALAQLDGSMLQKLGMGARELKNQAEAYLAKAAGSADVTKLAAENAALEERLAQLESLLKGQGALVQPNTVVAEPENSVSISPFQDWNADTIRIWIEEQGGEKPHHKCGHHKLVQIADELNAKLKQAQASEAA